MTTNITLTFPIVTGNHYKSIQFGKRRVFVTAKGRQYRNIIALDLMQQKAAVRYDVPIRVTMTIVPPDGRRRDIDNICKTLFDALTLGGLWTDDKLIKHLTVEVADKEKPGHIKMEVMPYESIS